MYRRIELEYLSTNKYLEVINKILNHKSTLKLDDKELDHTHAGNPIINTDGSFCKEYIDKQDIDGQIYLDIINKYFNENDELYQISEIIVDERQLDVTSSDDVDLSKSTQTINQLIRTDEVKDLVKYYLQEDNGFFAVKRRYFGHEKSEFALVKPANIVLPDNLDEIEYKLMNALTRIEPHKKNRWSEKRLRRTIAAAIGTYYIEAVFMAHEWRSIGRNYAADIVYNILDEDVSGIMSTGGELLLRGLEFLPTKEGLIVVGAGAALGYGPTLLTKQFWKERSLKSKSFDKDKEDMFEILLSE